MKFSDYEMLSTKMRNQDIATAITDGDHELARWVKKASDAELFKPDNMVECVMAMMKVNIGGKGLSALTDEQRRLLGDTVTLQDVWLTGTSSARVLAELEWKRLGRPYYNIWPSMTKPLTNCNLKGVLGRHVELPVAALLLRFPEPMGTIFYYKDVDVTFLWRMETDVPLLAMFGDDSTMEGAKISDDAVGASERSDADAESRMKAMLSTVAGIALLSHNKDIIEPIVLNADAHKFAQTRDPALIEKAKRKGTFGFNVGRHLETAPGFRQAHFATRWKGSRKNEGGLRPELVPVKGCMVHRKLVTEVPTGYLDKDEAVAAVSEGQD